MRQNVLLYTDDNSLAALGDISVIFVLCMSYVAHNGLLCIASFSSVGLRCGSRLCENQLDNGHAAAHYFRPLQYAVRSERRGVLALAARKIAAFAFSARDFVACGTFRAGVMRMVALCAIVYFADHSLFSRSFCRSFRTRCARRAS